MSAPIPVDHAEVYEFTANGLFKEIAGEVISANVTGGTLICYDGEDNTGTRKMEITSTSDTIETRQSFFFSKLYVEVSGTAFIKMR